MFYLQMTQPLPKDELVLQLASIKPVALGLQRLKKLKPVDAWAEAAT